MKSINMWEGPTETHSPLEPVKYPNTTSVSVVRTLKVPVCVACHAVCGMRGFQAANLVDIEDLVRGDPMGLKCPMATEVKAYALTDRNSRTMSDRRCNRYERFLIVLAMLPILATVGGASSFTISIFLSNYLRNGRSLAETCGGKPLISTLSAFVARSFRPFLNGANGEATNSDDVETAGQIASAAKKEASKARKRQKNESLTQHKAKPNSGKIELPPQKKPCKHWAEKGECKYGEKCMFLHAPLCVTSASKKPIGSGPKPEFAVLMDGKDDEEEKEGEEMKEAEKPQLTAAAAPLAKPGPADKKDRKKESKKKDSAKPKPEGKKAAEPRKKAPKRLDKDEWKRLIKQGLFMIAHDPKRPRHFRYPVFPVLGAQTSWNTCLEKYSKLPFHESSARLFKDHSDQLTKVKNAYATYARCNGEPVEEVDIVEIYAGRKAAEVLADHAARVIVDWCRKFAKPVMIELHQAQVNPETGCCVAISGALHWVNKRFRSLFCASMPTEGVVYDPITNVTSDKVYGRPVDTRYRHRFGNEKSLQVDSGYTAIVTVPTRKKYITFALRELGPLTLTEHTRRMGLQGALAHYELDRLALDHQATVREIQYIKNAVNWACQYLETKVVEDESRTSNRTKKALPIVDFPSRAN